MSREQGTLPPGCFGKLPFWPEFLEAEGAFPSARFLKEWIHQGRNLYGYGRTLGGAEISETLRRRLLLMLPGFKEILAGVIGPSSDLGGRRVFPFAVFVTVPRAHFGRTPFLAPLALRGAFEDLEDLWEALAPVPNQKAFEDTMQGFRIREPAPPDDARLSYRAGLMTDIERLLDRDDGVNLASLAGHLRPFLEEIRGATSSSTLFELPVSRDPADAMFDLSFWIDLINRPLWSAIEPSLFLDAKVGPRSRTSLLVARAPLATDYPAVMGGAEAEPSPVRIGHGSLGSRERTQTSLPTYGSLLGEKGGL